MPPATRLSPTEKSHRDCRSRQFPKVSSAPSATRPRRAWRRNALSQLRAKNDVCSTLVGAWRAACRRPWRVAASSSSGARGADWHENVPVDDSWSRRLTTPCAAQWSNELGRKRPNQRTRHDPVALRSPERLRLVDPVSGNHPCRSRVWTTPEIGCPRHISAPSMTSRHILHAPRMLGPEASPNVPLERHSGRARQASVKSCLPGRAQQGGRRRAAVRNRAGRFGTPRDVLGRFRGNVVQGTRRSFASGA